MLRIVMMLMMLAPTLSLADEPAEARNAPVEPAAPIAVVKTWSDLQNRPAIKVPGGPTVRVGIESKSIVRHGGVLVYLLLEGDTWAHAGRTGALGPLKILVEPEQQRERVKVLEQMGRQVRNAEWAGAQQLLFVATVPYEPGGALTVSLLSGPERVIAQTKLIPADDEAQPWFAFTGAAHRNGVQLGDEAVTDVMPDLNRTVVPEYDGDRPFDWSRKGDPAKPERALPRLSPNDGPTITVTPKRVGESNELIVKFPEQVMTAAIAHNLAARWWVDGEPVVVTLRPEREQQAEQARRFVRSDTLRLKLDIPDGSFGNFGGERVEVELLYCPDGVIDTGDMQRAMEQLMFVHGQKQRRRVPIRSNRVAFTLPHKFAMR